MTSSPTTAVTPAPGIEARGIVKRFANVPVLHGVTVAVRPGDVVGLVGHNGAGKSTLLRSIAGAIRPDGGTIRVDGRVQHFGSPADARRAGVAAVYQELSLLPNLTVTQNAFLGDERATAGLLRRRAMRQEAQNLVDRFGLAVDVDRRLGDYPVATRQLLEIAIAIHRDVSYLLLDEPTTSLEGGQVEKFLDTVRDLVRDQRVGVLLVDHKLEELYAVANRVVALVDGRVRIDGAVDEIPREEVVRAIAGSDAGTGTETGAENRTGAGGDRRRPGDGAGDDVGLAVRNLRTAVLDDVTLQAGKGRVLGIYGLVGSGRTELLRTLVGLDPVRAGTITLHGRRYRPRGPGPAQRAGVVYVTEERKSDGIVPELDSVMNVALPVLSRYRRFGLLDHQRMRRDATALLEKLHVRGDRSAPVVRLSGGNQQKVLLARALAQRPQVLLLDEPTKGVDLGVKAEIHRMVRDLAHRDGLTVIVVSSEEDEICEIADDVAVIVHGRSTGELLPARDLTPRALRQAAWEAA
ncbi:sugar ABC transporter ATP-binding protein [Solwaraspora sp. WMMD792]|uniref:sugar ABC transporter ATP-binding protein n=1 Tax=Solwaraspora sp. WMMD792 TaxID=3016099 RepID=UPI0024169A18|nr:sugar ABC transporter ATP-binding protein [Solwaraspora sp. WMMD792]MDG4771575.1 sugar ABC transporter ATP-binding protein [Solwaraspora sp. WMMD792]